jgi:hypothetical protein
MFPGVLAEGPLSPVAQLAEQRPVKAKVAGSYPARGAWYTQVKSVESISETGYGLDVIKV